MPAFVEPCVYMAGCYMNVSYYDRQPAGSPAPAASSAGMPIEFRTLPKLDGVQPAMHGGPHLPT